MVTRIFTSWNQIGGMAQAAGGASACRLSAEFCRVRRSRGRAGLQPTSYLRVFFAAKRGQHARIGTCFREAPPPIVVVRIPLQVEFCAWPGSAAQPLRNSVRVSPQCSGELPQE